MIWEMLQCADFAEQDFSPPHTISWFLLLDTTSFVVMTSGGPQEQKMRTCGSSGVGGSEEIVALASCGNLVVLEELRHIILINI